MREKKEQKTPGAESVPPELVAQAKAGDQAAFTELYERTSTAIYRTIHSMVRDEDLVWDIQQDSYLRAWRSLDKLEANEAFLPWLRRIAVNTAATALAKRVPLTFTELAGDEEDREPEIPDLNPDVQPELALDRKETARLVREILAELSPEQQAVVGMFYYEDMPVKDIAALLRISPSTVKNQLCRGRKKVEAGVRALEKQGVKLYGLSPLPFLLALLRRLEPAAGAEKKVLSAVLAEAPAATAAAGAAGSSAATVTALTASQAFLKGLGVKLLAGVLAVTMIAVGGKLAYDALSENRLPFIGEERPTAEETVSPSELVAPTKLYAPEDAPDNACGPNLTWRFDEATGTLTIEGSGEMDDFRTDLETNSPPPWISVCDLITSVALPNELSSIGSDAFFLCSKLTSMVIPESVTTIGDFAFLGCENLASVKIPESVTTIGFGAFDGCSSLRSVTIPESVTTIGEYAFSHCTGLTSVTIPEAVTSVGNGAFEGCTGLSAFSVHPDNENYAVDENGALYSKDYTALIACPGGKSGAFAIPNSVTTIGDNAFSGCEGLTSVTIPEGVTAIEYDAFSGCTELTSVTIPEGVTTIGDNAFSGCEGLTSVTIPEGVTTIGGHTFEDCFGLISITIPESMTIIGASAFIHCEGLTSVNIPEGVTSVGDYAFYGCTGLTSVVIPQSLTSIGEWVFSECSGLASVTIPESVISIKGSSFANCENLTIRGAAGSEAERYAEKQGIPFEAIP